MGKIGAAATGAAENDSTFGFFSSENFGFLSSSNRGLFSLVSLTPFLSLVSSN